MAARTGLRSGEALGLAWSLGWRIAAGLLAGYWLDDRLSTAPLLTLLFAIAALAAGVVQMLRLLDRQRGADGNQGEP